MAIQCKYCGTDLPKEDARFCNNCGMLVPSHPFSHQSLSALKNDSNVSVADSSDEPQEKRRRVLREQVAELSPARAKPEQSGPAKKLEASARVEEVPLEKLPDTPQPVIENDTVSANVEEVPERLSPPLASPRQTGVKGRMRGSAQASVSTPVWPAPVTHVSVKDPSAPVQRPDEQHEMAPVSTHINDEAAPAYETRVDARENEEIGEGVDAEETAIEDAPTRALAVPVEDVPTQTVNRVVEDVPTQATNVSVEDLPTRSIPVPNEKPSRVQEQAVEQVSPEPLLAAPTASYATQEQGVEDWRVHAQATSSAPVDAPTFQTHDYQPGSKVDNAAAMSPVRRSRRRWPIVVVVLLLVLVLGGVGTLGAMTLLSQQSSNDAIIQTQVGFSDPQLGLSLLYPNGWQKQVDAGKSTVHFYASNHIGQVDIMVTASSGTVKQALQQQATKMGMSGTKAGAALPFAGESWQQLQGTMQVSGANYTDAIVATTHGSQLFMIVQQAPQNNYADWEKEFFAPLRGTFKFL